MAKPIRERGIRWTETYGDKSAYLKEEFDQQVGPGSYFRWEGHDSYSGNDYYVVISPGHSDKHGYHFFAGLRKMPADHGASGKKFKTQREALSYAMEMWRVPRPNSMPPNWAGYTLDDIAGKAIVLEGTREASSGEDDGIVKTAMSMKAENFSGDFQRQQVDQSLRDQWCFAYRASPVMGFMAAMQAMARFKVLDVENMSDKGRPGTVGYNALTGEDNVPIRGPLISRPQPPPQDDFEHEVNGVGVEIENRLVDLVDAGRGGGTKDVVYRPGVGPAEGVTRQTWKDVTVRPRLKIPKSQLRGLAGSGFYQRMLDLGATDLPPYLQSGSDPNPKSTRDLEVRPRVPLSNYLNLMSEAQRLGVHAQGPTNDDEKRHVKLLQYQTDRGGEIDKDQAYREYVHARGSMLISYDSEWNPIGVMAPAIKAGQAKAGGTVRRPHYSFRHQEVPSMGGGTERVPGHVAMVDRISSPALEMLGWYGAVRDAARDVAWKLGLEAERRQMAARNDEHAKEYEQRASAYSLEAARAMEQLRVLAAAAPYSPEHEGAIAEYGLQGMPYWETLSDEISETPSADDMSALAAKADEVCGRLAAMNGRAAAGGAEFRVGGLYRYFRSQREAAEAAAAARAQEGDEGLAEDARTEAEAHKRRERYMRLGFREVASRGLVPLDASLVVDDRTCSSRMVNADKETWRTNDFGIPVKTGDAASAAAQQDPSLQGLSERELMNHRSMWLSPDDIAAGNLARAAGPYAPEKSPVRPVSETGPEGDVTYGRVFYRDWTDPATGQRMGPKFVYEPVRLSKEDVSGMPALVEVQHAVALPGQGVSLLRSTEGAQRWVDTETEGLPITGIMYDLAIRPKVNNADLLRKEKFYTPPGFNIAEEKHYAKMEGGVEGQPAMRWYAPDAAYKDNPKSREEKYTIHTTNPDGIDVTYEPSEYAYQEDGVTSFTQSWPALRLMQKTMNLPGSAVSAFTPMSVRDLAVIDHIAKDALAHYDQHKHDDVDYYLDYANRPNAIAGRKGQQRFALGQAAAAGVPDLERYAYGKTISECDKKKTVPAGVLEALANAVENPEAEMAPRRGTLWAIQYDGPEGPAQMADETGDTIYFGTEAAGNDALQHWDMASHPNSRLVRVDETPLVPSWKKRVDVAKAHGVEISEDFFMNFSLADEEDPIRKPDAESLEEAAAEEEEPVGPDMEDRVSPEGAPVDPEAAPEPTPGVEEPPPVQMPEAPVPEAPQARAEPGPAPAAPAPQTTPQRPAPAPRAPLPPETPESFVDKKLREGRGAHYIRLLTKSLHPEWAGDVEKALSSRGFSQASSIDRLRRLADRLDAQGRTSEADAVDRAIRLASGVAG